MRALIEARSSGAMPRSLTTPTTSYQGWLAAFAAFACATSMYRTRRPIGCVPPNTSCANDWFTMTVRAAGSRSPE